jgi:hypothetical protein
MRLRVLLPISLLTVSALGSAVGCGGHTGPLAPFPLEYRGVDSAPTASGSIANWVASRQIRIEKFVDKRAQPARIGVYEDEGIAVESTTNVSDFCSTQFAGMIAKAGGRVVTTGETSTIRAELIEFNMVEGGMYTADVRIHLQVLEKNAVLWDGIYNGRSKRWGRSHVVEMYNDGLSNALAEATRQFLLDESGFGKALVGGPASAPTVAPGAPAAPAAPGGKPAAPSGTKI